MKKLALILAGLLAASVLMVACTDEEPEATPNNQETIEGTETPETPEEPEDIVTPEEPEETEEPSLPEATGLEATINSLYEIFPVELPLMTIPKENIDANILGFLGLEDTSKLADYTVSETMIGSQAYSLVLVKVNENEDASAVADAMMNGIDPAKWICVQADLIKTVAHADTIMLVMMDSLLAEDMGLDFNGFVTAFEAVVGSVDYEAVRA